MGEQSPALEKHSSGYKKALGWVVAIALIIIINLIYTYGLKLFFTPDPFSNNSTSEQMKEQQACSEIYNEGNKLVTKEMCLTEDGIWTEYTDTAYQTQYTNIDGIEVKITGRCDLSNKAQECQNKLQKKYGSYYGNPYDYGNNSNYDRTKFFAGVGFGVIILIISIFIPATLSIIGISLAIGGVLVLVRSTFNFWSYFSDIWKFSILLIAFVALIFIVIKKLRK